MAEPVKPVEPFAPRIVVTAGSVYIPCPTVESAERVLAGYRRGLEAARDAMCRLCARETLLRADYHTVYPKDVPCRATAVRAMLADLETL